MFQKQFKHIFTKEALSLAFEAINKSSTGLDEVSQSEFKREFDKHIEELFFDLHKGSYTPEPLKVIEIKKQDTKETRPIALSSIKDKIVQRVLYDELYPYFDKFFSDKSYAYRENRSSKKAINRVTDFLNKGYKVALKSDIKDFFESIDHKILLEILKEHITDKRVLSLIALFLDIGGFKDIDYISHDVGVHQGDIISPLLSNIYLDKMDSFLEEKNIAFVRYADDFVILTKRKKEAKKIEKELKNYLKSLKLSLNEQKTYISSVDKGFSFLGVKFIGKIRVVENERFQKSISKLHKLSKQKQNFSRYIEELNSYLVGIKNYYLTIISKNHKQLDLLKEHLIEAIAQKIFYTKLSKEIKSKKEFRKNLLNLKLDIIFENKTEDTIEYILAIAKQKYLAYKSDNENSNKLKKKTNSYTKKFASNSTLHLSEFGLSLGFSKNKFVIKKYGKVQKSFPLSKVKRIILEGEGYSITSKVIQISAKEGITIDFIDRDYQSYASLITYRSSISQMIHKQANILNTPLHIQIASAILRAKAKNQLNYLKYQNKYHKNLQKSIKNIEKIIPKIKHAKSIPQMMGYEGSISAIYWDAIKLFLDAPFEARVTKGAKDIVNSSLNYGYAILYGVVQSSLVKAGLSLNISFLHTLDGQKPTLTFDMIEEFRSFVVDRTIFSMINKKEPIKLDKNGLLTKKSRKLISDNIKQKLGSYITWKKSYRQIQNIIQEQAYQLCSVVLEEKNKYKPFIGKY